MSTSVQSWMDHHGRQTALINGLTQEIVLLSSASCNDDDEPGVSWDDERYRPVIFHALITIIMGHVFGVIIRGPQNEFDLMAHDFFTNTLLKAIVEFSTTKAEQCYLLMMFVKYLVSEQFLVTEQAWYRETLACTE